ncbi:hypothetical protein [Ottowia thiooxydans]|uniref:hypothetical protein n=1 Tax=Ottowia thiooxydans TaxID=219182 RepID=UPI003391D69E
MNARIMIHPMEGFLFFGSVERLVFTLLDLVRRFGARAIPPAEQAGGLSSQFMTGAFIVSMGRFGGALSKPLPTTPEKLRSC